MAEWQELYGRMSGVILAECQELWWNVRNHYGGISGVMAECQELF